MQWAFSLKAAVDELLHHWSRLPLLSYLRPVCSVTHRYTTEEAVCGYRWQALLTVAVEAVCYLVSYYHADGAITQRSASGKTRG